MKATVGLTLCCAVVLLGLIGAEAKYTNVMQGLKALNLSFTEDLLATMRINLGNKSQVVTVLAPTEAAFAQYLASTGKTRQQFFANAPLVRSITLFSILPGISYTTFKPNQTLITQLGQFIKTVPISSHIVGLQGYLPNNLATPTKAIECGNGLILVTNVVLVPNLSPSPAPPSSPPSPPFATPGPFSNVLVALQQIPSLSSLYSLVLQSSASNNLTGILSAPSSNLTVFAFVDAALTTALASINVTVQQLAQSPNMPMMLCYGVMPGAMTKYQLTNAAINLQSLYGLTPIQVYQTPGNQIMISGNSFITTIISPEIKAGNSIIYLVDVVPTPGGLNWTTGAPASVQQAILQDPTLTVLQSLAKSTGALNANGLTNPNAVLTFFAPTDAAMNKYVAARNISLAALASNSGAGFKVLLTAQSFAGLYTLDELTNGLKMQSTAGIKSTITVVNNVVSLKTAGGRPAVAKVIKTAAQGSSWIVYLVDTVLI